MLHPILDIVSCDFRERRGSVVVSTSACHAAGRGSLAGPGTLLVKTRLSTLEIMYMCLSDETLKNVGPFYLVSMPGEVCTGKV